MSPSNPAEKLVSSIIDSDITKAKKLSKSLTHLSEYPLVDETSKFLLSFQVVNYLVNLSAKVFLDAKSNVIDSYFGFITKAANVLDSWIDSYVLKGIDGVFPFLSKIHYKDLTPSNIINESIKYSKRKYESLKPVILKHVDAVLSPVNNKFEKVLNRFFSTEISVNKGSKNEAGRFVSLVSSIYPRSKPLVHSKLENVKNYPSHVSKIYQDELAKNEKSIPKAVVKTSVEISNETLSSLGFNKVEFNKTNGILNWNGVINHDLDSLQPKAAAVSDATSTNANINGEISVGA